MYGVTARLCRYWHTHTHRHIYSDRQTGIRTSWLKIYDFRRWKCFVVFFSCVKITDSDSRCICNPHLSISLAWHGSLLGLPYYALTHRHTSSPFTLRIFRRAVAILAQCILRWMMMRAAWGCRTRTPCTLYIMSSSFFFLCRRRRRRRLLRSLGGASSCNT